MNKNTKTYFSLICINVITVFSIETKAHIRQGKLYGHQTSLRPTQYNPSQLAYIYSNMATRQA